MADVIDRLIAILHDGNVEDRCQAALALGGIVALDVDKRVFPALLSLLMNDAEVDDVRERAMFAMREDSLKDAAAIEPLIAATKDKNPVIRGQAASTLRAFLPDPRVLDALITMTKDGDLDVQLPAIASLRFSHTKKAVIALGEVIQAGEDAAIIEAIQALKDISDF